MSELSQGAYLAWRLAAGETARTLHPCIEKEFVLIGLCGLGRWLRSKAQGENAPLKGQSLRAVSTEAQTIEEALTVCAVAPDLLGQAVRAAIGKGLHRRGEEIVHRSTSCKACFQRAEAIAESVGAPEVHCLHVLAAIMEQPGALITRVITEAGVNIEALRAAVEAALVALNDRQVPEESTADKLFAGPDQVAQPQAASVTQRLPAAV